MRVCVFWLDVPETHSCFIGENCGKLSVKSFLLSKQNLTPTQVLSHKVPFPGLPWPDGQGEPVRKGKGG